MSQNQIHSNAQLDESYDDVNSNFTGEQSDSESLCDHQEYEALEKKRSRSQYTVEYSQNIIDPSDPSSHDTSLHLISHEEEKEILKLKNREHAKKTRLRKKHYIESLEQQVKNLSEERQKWSPSVLVGQV